MSPTPTKRVAIYARVSTFDKGQDPETQLLQLREYAGRRGFDIAGEYVDYATGTNEDRANYQRLLDDVRKRQVDLVLVWRYDRFARSSRSAGAPSPRTFRMKYGSSATRPHRFPLNKYRSA